VAVTLGQVIVHCDDVHFSHQGVEISGHGGDQGFPFAGFHLRDPPLVKDNPAQNLDIEGVKADGPFRGFPHHRKGFGKDLIRSFAPG